MDAVITASEAASLLGVANADNANRTLRRLGVRPIGRQAGRGGENTYDRAAVDYAIAQRPGQGARTDLRDVGAGVELCSWGRYGSHYHLADEVTAFLGEFESDYDVPALAHAYREAINAALDGTEIALVGDDFYGTYPVPDNWDDLIREAVTSVDLGELIP